MPSSSAASTRACLLPRAVRGSALSRSNNSAQQRCRRHSTINMLSLQAPRTGCSTASCSPRCSSSSLLRLFRPATVHQRRLSVTATAPDSPEGPRPSSSAPSTPPPAAAPVVPPTPSSTPSGSGSGSGGVLAGAAVGLGVVAFAASRLLVGGPSLAALEQQAVPLEVALSNGKPTVMEFYANWCEVCRELVPVEVAVEEAYADRVNFVMLNVENPKWGPELAEYRVGGIPHFVFLDGAGQPLAAAVGKLPASVLQGNVAALASGEELPYARIAAGPTSSLTPPPGAPSSSKVVGPRDHA